MSWPDARRLRWTPTTRVRTDDGTMLAVEGLGETHPGPTVVFVHGWTFSSRSFHYQRRCRAGQRVRAAPPGRRRVPQAVGRLTRADGVRSGEGREGSAIRHHGVPPDQPVAQLRPQAGQAVGRVRRGDDRTDEGRG